MTIPKLPDEEEVLRLLRRSHRGPLKAKQIARELDVPDASYRAFRDLLGEMAERGRIERERNQRYRVPDRRGLVEGRVSVTRSGDAFVVQPAKGERDEDVFVPWSALGNAMHEDLVLVKIESRPRGRNPVGRVVRVVERAHERVVGTYRSGKRYGTVMPHDEKLPREIVIPDGAEGGARDTEVVVARIVQYGDRHVDPVGEVEKVLGPLGAPGVDVLAIAYRYELPLEFPEEVEAAARRLAEERGERADPGRVDRRDLHVFTIDPADAKDHDDALSITPLGDGRFEVGVHIADVSYYVDVGSETDLEALERGTSVYLVDRVIPMLPHSLSSEICSLRPDEDRKAVSLFTVLDEEGGVHEHRFERTWIRSRRRLSYERAQAVLDGGRSADPPTDRALEDLAALARQLARRRVRRGSLDFDLPEARVVLGEEGEPVEIVREPRYESHRLIESFMLMANEIVARRLGSRPGPAIFRVHEPPREAKLEDLREFLATLGLRLPEGEVGGKALQRVLDQVKGRPEEALVETVTLRAMNRARYDVQNVGHFGLAAEWYTHFTSPIRRYPDLVVHRLVVTELIGAAPAGAGSVDGRAPGGPARALQVAAEDLEFVAVRSSERERRAEEAERESVELKKVEYMERHLGDEFEGTISGVTAFGFFVLLDEVFVEGLVHVESLRNDYYVFREEAHSLIGNRTRRRFRLGDRVRVRVARADRMQRQIDFVLAGGLD